MAGNFENKQRMSLWSASKVKTVLMVLSLILMMDILGLQNNLESNSPLLVNANRQRRKREGDERDITAKEVEEITDDKTIEDDPDELAKKAMMEEWDEHMSDFVPNDMLSVQLNPREEIVSNFHFYTLIWYSTVAP